MSIVMYKCRGCGVHQLKVDKRHLCDDCAASVHDCANCGVGIPSQDTQCTPCSLGRI